MSDAPERKPLYQWGVRELARATGISPTTVIRVKRGAGDFDLTTMKAILAATGQCMCCNAALDAEKARADAAEAERDALKSHIENDADWKFSAKRRLQLFREQRTRADAAEAALKTAREALTEASQMLDWSARRMTYATKADLAATRLASKKARDAATIKEPRT